MRTIRSFAALIAAALAAIAAFTVELVWDGARWVARIARRSLAPPHQEGLAEAALDVETDAANTEDAAARAAAEAHRHALDFGLAALSYLVGDEAQRAEARRGLDNAAAEFLDGLGLDHARAMLDHTPVDVAAHLTGGRPIPLMPRPEDPAARAARLAAEQARDAEDERGRRVMAAVLSATIAWVEDPDPDYTGALLTRLTDAAVARALAA